MSGFSTTLTVLGGLGLFLYGMKVMSESLQVATGDKLRAILGKITSNRIAGVATGFTITAVIQSSSATTVMLVSFVNAGLISLKQSIGVILGANIGTTFTGWLVAIIGFQFQISTFALPAIGIGFGARFLNTEKVTYWGEVLLGFGLLFLGLSFMSGAVQDLRGSDVVMNFMSMYRAESLLSTILVVIVGTLVTMLVQSSSATVAMTMALAYNGIIDFPTSCALILGENIGTTITANIASIGTSVHAKRSARVHMIFNVLGVVWMMVFFRGIVIPLVDQIVPGPFTQSQGIALHMAAFHTFFNAVNTLLFLPFVSTLAWLAIKLVPMKETKIEEEEKTIRLKYISTHLLSTPSLNINQAKLEIRRMTKIILDMHEQLMVIFRGAHEKLGEVVEKIQLKENLIDALEIEISKYLVNVSRHNISQQQSYELSGMLHMVNELERIGDHCETLLKLIRRKYENGVEFTETATHDIEEIARKVREFLVLLDENITSTGNNILPKARVIENRINEMRIEARKKHTDRLSQGSCDVDRGLIFIDMLNSFEKIGDHATNVAESISGIRIF